MSLNLYVVATVGILMVAIGVVLVLATSRGAKMAIQRKFETVVRRATGIPAKNCEGEMDFEFFEELSLETAKKFVNKSLYEQFYAAWGLNYIILMSLFSF